MNDNQGEMFPIPPVVKFKKLHEKAKLPTYAKEGDAGMDLYAVEPAILRIGDAPRMVATGLACEVPPGYFMSIRERSGLAIRGVRVGGGVLDSGYRGEIKVILSFQFHRIAGTEVRIEIGDRIAQAIIQPYATATIEEVKELGSSERGSSGWGSTGK